MMARWKGEGSKSTQSRRPYSSDWMKFLGWFEGSVELLFIEEPIEFGICDYAPFRGVGAYD